LASPSIFNGNAQPNIIVLMADDVSARELGCYGHRQHYTPILDGLARDGCKFRTCWATPLCRPTRAELFTGRYGFRTGWYHNQLRPQLSDPNFNLATSNLTFAQVLRNAGYATMACGKWQITGTVEEHAFDEHCLWEADRGSAGSGSSSLPQLAPRYWQPAIIENGTPLVTTPDDYGPEIFVDFLLDFMARHRDRPQLIYHSMPLAHVEWDTVQNAPVYSELPVLDAAGRWTGAKEPGSLRSSVQ
jgi:arylsulfatase A-like enzyme